MYEMNYMSFEDKVKNSQKSNYNESSIFDSIYDTAISIENEAENYLTSICEHRSTDPILFWKQNQIKYPKLSLMARDFLRAYFRRQMI